MHVFDYKERPEKLLTPEVVNQLGKIHELKGRQELFIEAAPDVLTSLLEIAKIQSTKASNKIEGIWTSDERLEAIVKEKSQPRNRSEEEISGYRDVLATIHESYEYITPRPNNILQLHRDLYRFSDDSFAGKWKDSDNIIAERLPGGRTVARFTPTSAAETPAAMERICSEYSIHISKETYDPLLISLAFVFDFVSIHPFNDGNGRMSRLLTLLLLYRSGYTVGKYISIEKVGAARATAYRRAE